jgi:hypothetical protein
MSTSNPKFKDTNNYWPKLKADVKVIEVKNLEDLEKVECKENVILLMDLRLYKEALKSRYNFLERCTLIIKRVV